MAYASEWLSSAYPVLAVATHWAPFQFGLREQVGYRQAFDMVKPRKPEEREILMNEDKEAVCKKLESPAEIVIEHNGMKTIIVSLVAPLIASFFAYAAYREQDPRFLMGTLFFPLLVLLNMKNAGAVESPYLYLAFATVSIFYSFTGLADGIYTWRSFSVDVQREPTLFWAVFSVSILSGVGFIAYAYAQLRGSQRRP